MTKMESKKRGRARPWLGPAGLLIFLITGLASSQPPPVPASAAPEPGITHVPILGRLSHDGIGVWVRTSSPSRFRVTCRLKHVCVAQSPFGETRLQNDNTGWVQGTGLKPNTTYDYEVMLDSGYWMNGGSFTTLPDEDTVRNPNNPSGLFNFSFEFGCGNH